jgi:hypothetical protein
MGSEAGLDVLRGANRQRGAPQEAGAGGGALLAWDFPCGGRVRWVILSDEISPQVYSCLVLAGHEIRRACEFEAAAPAVAAGRIRCCH